ncbi:MAG TPA: chromo domain-containing protein [Methylomicrobium sp.]|nr:chromo domain-containing protein [Methylomicrobium sp.]
MNWRVLIADYTTAEADVFLRFVDPGFLFLTPMGLPMDGLDAALETTYKSALRHLGVPSLRNFLTNPEPIVVTNPELLNFGAVMHVPDREDLYQRYGPRTPPLLERSYIRGIEYADSLGYASIAIPLPDVTRWAVQPAWAAAPVAAEALRRAKTTGALRRVDFILSSLQDADVFALVLNRYFPLRKLNPPPRRVSDEINEDEVKGDEEPPKADAEWWEIDEVVRRQKRNGRDMFLVRWKDSDETAWVKRQDLSPAALQQFYATKGKRRRRRKH